MSDLLLNETNSTDFEPGHPYTVTDDVVDVHELRAHQDNTYGMDGPEIESLAENILEIGLITPLIVRRVADGGLQILSGHRRARALKRICKDRPEYAQVPVRIYEGLSDQDALLILHSANITRRMTQSERVRQSEELKAQVASLRDSHPEWRGVNTTDIIANMLGIPARSYRRQLRLANKLDPRLHGFMENKLMSQHDAEQLTRLPLEEQARVADAIERAEPKDARQTAQIVSDLSKTTAEYREEFLASVRSMNVAWFRYRDALRREGIPEYMDKDELRPCLDWLEAVMYGEDKPADWFGSGE